jgi:hypothetical protein
MNHTSFILLIAGLLFSAVVCRAQVIDTAFTPGYDRHAPYSTPGAPPDTSNHEQSRPPRKIQLIRREYNHRKQVVVAASMMALVVFMVTSAQMWNPD